MTATPTTSEIRRKFLDFFQERGHTEVQSSSLIPAGDDTLLFTNAGMVPFKDTFLGRDERPYVRATSSQRCVRAGGKHNDLENVGYTARHHTFFEMLGNFSFGDYFKRDAITYAWDFLTKELGLPAEKLWVTVFEDDDEAADIWLKEIGVSAARFSRIGAKDNFWSMGDTGPCGPCTEIFYDHGEHVWGGPPGTPEEDGDRYIEIWNLVFMQYNRTADGKMAPLPKPSVDTGMGLERLAAVLQHVHSNYEIDLFQNLLAAVSKETGCRDMENSSLRVIADHIRSCAFMIADGVLPSNEGRGYVLRRIIRRALRHGHKLGQGEPFFHKLVSALNNEMGEAYPELNNQVAHITKILAKEEEDFARLLVRGMALLEESISQLDGQEIPGDVVFKLYDTYGFPFDLTADVARERELTLDEQGYEAALAAQKAKSRAGGAFNVDYNDTLDVAATQFDGYDKVELDATVVAITKGGELVDCLRAGEEGFVFLNETPFYAESGGQVGDTGTMTGNGVEFNVTDTQKQQDAFAHIGTLTTGTLKVGDSVGTHVDNDRRRAIVLNHSATHLMHAGLRQILGEHVQQKGSLVNAELLRFDFSHYEGVTSGELKQVEDWVNQQIRANGSATAKSMSLDDAKAAGAMALFDAKYGDEVRVMRIGDESIELCGGCHVQATGEIGLFKIISEGGVASGIRRIEAITGEAALQWVQERQQALTDIGSLFKASADQAKDKVVQLVERTKKLEKELEQLKTKLATGQGGDIASNAVQVGDINVLATCLDGADVKALRAAMDQLKGKLAPAAIVLATVEDGKVRLVAGVTKDATDKVKAGELVNHVATQVGGKGGGRPDMAQAGGTDASKLDEALASVAQWVETQIS